MGNTRRTGVDGGGERLGVSAVGAAVAAGCCWYTMVGVVVRRRSARERGERARRARERSEDVERAEDSRKPRGERRVGESERTQSRLASSPNYPIQVQDPINIRVNRFLTRR